MWVVFALLSALFAGVTAILAKCGIRRTDSTVATALRTIVVLAFSWLMVFIKQKSPDFSGLRGETLIFLFLSGLATGASWLCYFRALKLGDINKVTPVDKLSTVLTILISFVVFSEPVSVWRVIGTAGIGIGTVLMIQKKHTDTEKKTDTRWLFYALLSAVFAAMTSVLGKLGVKGVDSDLASAVRTGVVLVMAWFIVFLRGKAREAVTVRGRELVFILSSGVATGASWLCFYRALSVGPASGVTALDKMSILVTVAFSYLVLGEKLSKKAVVGLGIITLGTLALVLL